MSREKQIKDMVADIEQTGMLDTTSRCEIVAKELYNKGYRKHIGEPADLDITRDGVEYCLNAIGYRKQSEGEWVTKGDIFKTYHCSVCNYSVDYPKQKTTYCPNCGAKMEGGRVYSKGIVKNYGNIPCVLDEI